MKQVSKAAQEHTISVNIMETASNALSLAEDALIKAKEALAAAGGSMGSKPSQPLNHKEDTPESTTKGSAGRNPSPEQVEIRANIIEALESGELVYFTIAEITEAMKADRIQTRNAVNYLETQGKVVRYGEKLPEGRGQRELIYKSGVSGNIVV